MIVKGANNLQQQPDIHTPENPQQELAEAKFTVWAN